MVVRLGSRTTVALALAAVLMVAAACGDDDDADGTNAASAATTAAATTHDDHASTSGAATTAAAPTTAGASTTSTTAPPPPPGADLVEPEVIASEGGVLATTLDAKVSPVEVGGKQVSTLVYNGQFPGPTLRVKAGDDLRVELVNGSDGGTNLHTHGFHV